jgi:hypothetical protein
MAAATPACTVACSIGVAGPAAAAATVRAPAGSTARVSQRVEYSQVAGEQVLRGLAGEKVSVEFPEDLYVAGVGVRDADDVEVAFCRPVVLDVYPAVHAGDVEGRPGGVVEGEHQLEQRVAGRIPT